MAELKCPHCGQAFTVDDTELSSIIKQIRDSEFEKDIHVRLEQENKRHALELKAQENDIRLKTKEAYDKEIESLKEQLRKAESEHGCKLRA